MRALAARAEALGLLDEHLREAILTHVTIMRTATTPRGTIDWAARQRSAAALLALGRLVGTATREHTPLVSLTLVR